ncbi:MAG: hypothetical protein RL033_2330 [Pseudomonadota bacterium]|jgi:hypothetical protein
MRYVNGLPCVNCADEVLAKRQIDPRKGVQGTQLEARAEREREQLELGVNAPQAGAAVGSRLNVYA